MFTPRLGLILATEKYRVPHSPDSASQQSRTPSSISFVHLLACLLACLLASWLAYVYIHSAGQSVSRSVQSVSQSVSPFNESFILSCFRGVLYLSMRDTQRQALTDCREKQAPRGEPQVGAGAPGPQDDDLTPRQMLNTELPRRPRCLTFQGRQTGNVHSVARK